VHLTENVMVPMRDGVRMATDIYRPARAGQPLTDRRPVLLHRTPYNKVETEATSGQCRYFASRGYSVVTRSSVAMKFRHVPRPQSSSVSFRQNIGTSTIGMFSISPRLSRSLSAVTM
jgi:hypothetical protein